MIRFSYQNNTKKFDLDTLNITNYFYLNEPVILKDIIPIRLLMLIKIILRRYFMSLQKDVTEYDEQLKILFERERKIKLICAELNNFTNLKSTLSTIIQHIKKITNCEAVGIRLHDNGDYPYYVSDGFPETFILKENSLCAKSESGEFVKVEKSDKFLLECMCGNIIRGRFDPTFDFFTQNGSFWSNNTTFLLSTTTEKERQENTRNYCNSCGYESVALVPIKSEKKYV